MANDLGPMIRAITKAIPGATVTVTENACPDCLGDGVVPIVDGHADDLVDCKRCLGYGFASYGEPAVDIDDADHAEYVDPIDHSHDVAISSEAAVARLAAVLDIHRRTEDHVCAAEPFYVFPCPTARAALGVK